MHERSIFLGERECICDRANTARAVGSALLAGGDRPLGLLSVPHIAGPCECPACGTMGP